MSDKIKWISLIRQISSILLLFTTVLQIVVIILLEADIDISEIDEYHEVIGFIFMGLMVIHIWVYWKNVKSLFLFKSKIK
jgi:hypothetical protein